MWDYLASLQGTINNVIAFATAQPRVTELLLKRPPSKKEEDLKKLQSDQGQAQEEVIRGSLHYLFDGVMPFIMVFCRSYYQPDTSMFPDEPENIDNLTKTFKAFIQVMAPLISIEKQMKNLVACMTTLLSASTLPVREMEEFQEKYGRGVTAQDVRSAARRDYDEYYAAELEINAQLNVFAVNMKVAYGGLNTVQAQIGYDSDLPYSELGGDEELPLGQEFQEHLKCFIDNTKKLPKDKYKMAEKLVKQMQISQNLTNLDEKEKLEQLDLDVKCLQLLRGLIYNEIVKLPDDWESESSIHIRQLNIIEKTQKALDDYGVVIGVLDHLARPQDQVVREVLAFMSSLLFNGNDQVQASLIKYFTGTREETFFFSIKSRMQMSALATREKRLLNAMHQAKLEEALQQAKALQKAMKSGKAAQDQLQQANQLGSMLSIAKRSMLNLQGASGRLKGSRLSLGKRTPTGSAMGSRMMLKSSNAHPVSNGVTGKAAMMSKSSLNGKGRVGPQPPEIQIEHVADEELEELMQSAVGQEDELEFKDDGYIELVLRILGLMCDNQHHDLQDYLREQPDNIKSVNLVAETTRFLSILYSNITTQSMPLICQLFDTLVEFTSGNQQNQAVVFDNKICDYMNHILRVGSFKGCSKKEIYELKKSIGTLIRSLSEENPPEEESEEDTVTTLSKNDNEPQPHRRFEFKVNLNLPSKKEVMEYMDEDTLMNTMTDAYLELMLGQAKQKQKNDPDHQELMELYSEVGFIYFHILCRKNDLDYMVTKESMIKKAENQLAWDYFAANTMSIEIVKNNELQKLYFRVKDTKVLREEIKDKFKYEVDRTTPSNKLRSFMDWSSDIIQDIKYQRKVYANPIGRLLVKLWLPMNYLVLFLSVVMAILMMVFWVDPKLQSGESDIDSRKPDFTWDGYPYLVYGIGGIHNLFSFLVLVTFLISNKPTFPPYRKFKNLIRKNDDDEEDFRAWHEKKLDSHLEIPIYSVKTIYYMTFLACSILGTIFYGYFFAFHLLHIAQLNQLLKRVIQAVTTNGMSLLLVALLGLGIFYIYALVAFAFLREDFLQEAAGRHCRTVGQCLLTMVHHGFC
ncbi:hypothetical protein KUTeg_011526 [Tegillarca granosa]|uniref:RyR/IP3R Homology associated domain-containing protein n=1 Tax=Tegillarca granosa TaxID=220873 RepID=A0ABQ9EZC3_TEGGR|nr:hypothetical protein KUTeg_011526 [Tegillarca granosa]